jgi:mono/diheme cytochrome c family protein
VVVGLVGSGVRAAASDSGRSAYLQYCASCHGRDGQGDGPVAPSLRTAPTDLTRVAERRGGRFSQAEIAAYIDGRTPVPAHGPREMPVWGQKLGERLGNDDTAEELVRGRLLVLVEYLQSIQR